MRPNCIAFCLFIFIVTTIGGCSYLRTSPKIAPQTIHFVRFDLAIDSLATQDSFLLNTYASFLPLYYSYVLKTEGQSIDNLKKFSQNTATRSIQLRIKKYLSDLEPEQLQIEQAFGYWSYYFPRHPIPEVIYTHISPFGTPILTTPQFASVALDRYLGRDFDLYQGLFEPFQLERMNKEQIPTDVLLAWLYRTFPLQKKNATLLDRMLYEGAIYSVLKIFFPERMEESLLQHTSEQMKWLKKNEARIWTRIIEQGHLYSTNTFLQGKYLNPAPFTAPIDPLSPAQIGIWIGMRIIEKQLTKKEALPLDSILINGFDAYQLLSKARYNGK